MRTTKRIVELKNKSRQGRYLYIKAEKKQGRYYKLKEEEAVEAIERYFEDKYNKRKKLKGTIYQYKKAYKGVKTWKEYKISPSLKRQVQKYLREVSKRPTISQAIKKGLTQVTIKDLLRATPRTIQEAHKQLLHELVIDDKLLEDLSKPENTKKMKTRYENKITIYNKTGEIVTEATKYNTTPEDVLKEIQKEFRAGMEVDYPEKILRKLGYQVEGKTEKNTIQRISLRITFRKGR